MDKLLRTNNSDLITYLTGRGIKQSEANKMKKKTQFSRECDQQVAYHEVFSPYDMADYLKTEEDIAAFLDAVGEESGDDPELVTRALDVVLRARQKISGANTDAKGTAEKGDKSGHPHLHSSS